LTARGKKIYEASLGLMKSLDDLRNEVNATQDVMTGELNIGIVDNIIWDKEAPLSAVFREFSSIASEVDLTLYVLSPDEIERRLIDGRLHVGIAPVMHELASLAYESLFEKLNYLYCGREHPLFDRADSDISTAELVRCQYVEKNIQSGFADERSGCGVVKRDRRTRGSAASANTTQVSPFFRRYSRHCQSGQVSPAIRRYPPHSRRETRHVCIGPIVRKSLEN
jgi:DNA-binding transcriptional LysR family regulator